MEKETALPKNIRQIGEVRGEEKICLEDYVMTCIHKKEQQEKEGYLGIFFGERRREAETEYVFIRGILELSKTWEPESFARVSNPVCSPRFRASASVVVQQAAFATGVPPNIYAFHRYTRNSACLSDTQGIQFWKQFMG